MLTKERKEKVVDALQKAIQVKSYSGEEKGVVEYLEKLFKDIGYDTVHIDRYGNIIGCIKGKKNGLKVLMDGHMDTVPVQEEKWKENAFGGEIKDGKIYGRGTSDMKGALISMALAGAYFAEDTKKDFSGEINAVYKMMKLIEKIKTLPMTHQDKLGYGILELTDIKSLPYPGASVVPDYCRATYDRRLLVGETMEGVLKPIQDCINELKKEDPELEAKVSYAIGKEKCWTGEEIKGERFFPGWLYDEKEEYIQKAYSGLKAIGQNPIITYYNFCTNGSHYAGEAKIHTIGYGPSKENLAHVIDEYVEVEQIEKVTEGYYAILDAYLGK